MGVQDIINGAVNVQKGISGIQATFRDVPSSINQLPCFVTYVAEGELEFPRKPQIRTTTHTIDMDLYIQKGGDLAAADRLLKSFIDTTIDAFDQAVSLSGTVLYSGISNYKSGVMSFADVSYIGVKFTLKAVEKKGVIYKA